MIHIDSVGFGQIAVNGQRYRRDIKIIGDNVIANWRRLSGHRVQVDDVIDVLEALPEYFVLGKGKPGLMRSTDRLRQRLADVGISLIEERNSLAIQTFNRLSADSASVAAGFHLTC
jgi:hypothetical protein